MKHPSDCIAASIAEHQRLVVEMRALEEQIAIVARIWHLALAGGGQILLCGNGGSASDCQHIAAELTGRFERIRRPLRAIALTTDTSAITAIANDFGAEYIFSRQVEALARAGDVLVAISTSGNSPAVLNAARTANAVGATVTAMTGASGGGLASISDSCLRVPSQRTARIQEMHILIGHCLCECLDEWTEEVK
jgi:D-sedoheptulose 7-phosphate isomerase